MKALTKMNLGRGGFLVEKKSAKKFSALFLASVILLQPVTVLAENSVGLISKTESTLEAAEKTIASTEATADETALSADAAKTEEENAAVEESDTSTSADELPEESISEDSASGEELTEGAKVTDEAEETEGTEGTEDTETEAAEETDWQYLAFGESATTGKNTITVNEDDSVKISSVNNGGKLLSNGTDGVGYYFTKISKEDNFTLSAKITVDSWTFSNAQEGFLAMIRDAVPEASSTAAHYSNSFAFMGGRYVYNWDSATNQVSVNGDASYNMRLGVGARYTYGVPDAATHTTDVSVVPLESAATDQTSGTYNLIGNATNLPNASITNLDTMLTTFDVTLRKSNSGFEILYTDPITNKTYQETYWDWEEMYTIDKDYVYAGFAASRNMEITVSDISLALIDPADDEPARERPKETVELTTSLSAPATSATAAYEARFFANADGLLEVRNADTKEVLISDLQIDAGDSERIGLTLVAGENRFEATFTPDKEYLPGELQIMDSYEPVELGPWTVDYRSDYYDTLYVTPTGTAAGSGSIEAPLDIQTALNFAKAGTTIILQGGTYDLTRGITISRNLNGTEEHPIVVRAEEENRPILNFGNTSAGILHWGSFWHFYGFDVTNTADKQKGFTISGHHNTVENVQAYNNGDTGIQISGDASEGFAEWPRNNLIKNCTSFNNYDAGFEDADGFAAKLTVGEGNVFDGCIAHHNADDGWDLFARVESGPIGIVTIKNSVAYENGFVTDGPDLTGNGNGFKMGGSSVTGPHVLINSLAFENLAKGIDSNSGPDIKVYSSTSLNNQSYNVAFYTNNPQDTDFLGQGILSYRTDYLSLNEQLRPQGSQLEGDAQIWNATNFYWDTTAQQSLNTAGTAIAGDSYQSSDTKNFEISRYDNGSINVNGLMQPKTNAAKDAVQIGAVFTETTSPATTWPEAELVSEADMTLPDNENNPIMILEANGNTEDPEENLFAGAAFTIGVQDFLPNQNKPVVGDAYFVPVSYLVAAAQGSLDAAVRATLFTAELTAPAAGVYDLEVTYSVAYYDGEAYVASGETVTQTRTLAILAAEESETEDSTTEDSTTEDSTTDSSNTVATDSTDTTESGGTDNTTSTSKEKEKGKDQDNLPHTSDNLNIAAIFAGIGLLLTVLGAVSIKLSRKKA